jgi:hypothetical protein
MSDLISRQAVLNALKEHRSLFCDNTPETFSKLSYAEKSRVDELDTAIATIINLPSVENKGEWIPVSERLPEEGTHILVSVSGEPDFVATDDYYSYGFDDWKDDVTAWQPLPEPYKGESGISE